MSVPWRLSQFSGFSEIFTTACISGPAYGFHTCIAASTLVILAKQGNQNSHRAPHGVFVALLFLLGTINISIHLYSLLHHLQNMALMDIYDLERIVQSCLPLFPQGRYTLEDYLGCFERLGLSKIQTPYTRKEKTSFVPPFDIARGQEIPTLFISILAQTYLLLRCHSLWGKCLVTMAMGVLLPIVIAAGVLNIYFMPPDKDIITQTGHLTWLSSGNPVYILPRGYWGLALGYNLSANTLIVGRLLWLRAKVTSAMGKEFGKIYSGLAAMLMESSTLYSVVLIVGYTVLPGDGGSASLFSPLVAQTEAIAAELIILRLALGRALSRREVVTVTAKPDGSDPSAQPMNSNRLNTDGTTSLVRRAPRRRTSRAGVVGDTAHTTFSLFPSSVAAVLRSYQGDSTGSERSADIIRMENTRFPRAGTSEPA